MRRVDQFAGARCGLIRRIRKWFAELTQIYFSRKGRVWALLKLFLFVPSSRNRNRQSSSGRGNFNSRLNRSVCGTPTEASPQTMPARRCSNLTAGLCSNIAPPTMPLGMTKGGRYQSPSRRTNFPDRVAKRYRLGGFREQPAGWEPGRPPEGP